ncbi:hypothetical protein NDU88_004198 [Pleurodeles waltl]|uniref:Uncharacterized protein n=1 Tax=Pleurodeles waltl TaxID=8319 RepID=A0AAV7V0K4_PLEWA|nr:hypothetical protein NDU88_004198 [Pleurodeles waltl]
MYEEPARFRHRLRAAVLSHFYRDLQSPTFASVEQEQGRRSVLHVFSSADAVLFLLCLTRKRVEPIRKLFTFRLAHRVFIISATGLASVIARWDSNSAC